MESMRFWKILKRANQNIASPIGILERRNYSKPRIRSNNLFSKLSPLGHPTITLAPVIDKWVADGRNVGNSELKAIIKDFRSRKRYSHALQVSEWMSSKRKSTFSPSDHALQLDLIGRVRGIESAESYFKDLNDKDKTDKTFGALLNCYVREGLIEKSLNHMKKMTKMGFASSTLTYNDIMCLYYKTGHLDKVFDVLSEMKENNISPDNYSYRICITSCASRGDLIGVEKLLEEIENQPDISLDWLTCSTVANIFVKAGLKVKALVYIKKCEELVDKTKNPLGYNHLISLHASLGNKDEILRVWGVAKTKCKRRFNRDYITVLGSLVNIGELEESEKLLQEWELSGLCYDFRVPNVVLIGYCKKGLVEKAEAILRDAEKKKRPIPNSWAIISSGYLDKRNMEKAFQCMKEALIVQTENKGWRPKVELISSVLSWLGANGDVEDVELFAKLLETKIPKNREVCHTLLKVYIRCGKEIDVVLASMRDDNIVEDEETERILRLREKNGE